MAIDDLINFFNNEISVIKGNKLYIVDYYYDHENWFKVYSKKYGLELIKDLSKYVKKRESSIEPKQEIILSVLKKTIEHIDNDSLESINIEDELNKINKNFNFDNKKIDLRLTGENEVFLCLMGSVYKFNKYNEDYPYIIHIDNNNYIFNSVENQDFFLSNFKKFIENKEGVNKNLLKIIKDKRYEGRKGYGLLIDEEGIFFYRKIDKFRVNINNKDYEFPPMRVATKVFIESKKLLIKEPIVYDRYTYFYLPSINQEKQPICLGKAKGIFYLTKRDLVLNQESFPIYLKNIIDFTVAGMKNVDISEGWNGPTSYCLEHYEVGDK